MAPAQKVEPWWYAALLAAMRRRRTPQVYLLVSFTEAEALAAGRLPRRLMRQARRMIARCS